MNVSTCDRCAYNSPIGGCVHGEGWMRYYAEDIVTGCEWFEEEKE